MLIMPPTPSGSYLAEGLVITSTFSIIEAAIFSIEPRLPLPVVPLLFPSTRMVTFASPAIETTPSISTSTEGTFLNTSAPLPPADEISRPTLNIFLSMVCTNVLSSPITSIASIFKVDMLITTLPRFCLILPPSLGYIFNGPISFFLYPMNSTTATYFPSGISSILIRPSLSLSPPVIRSLCSRSTNDTEAYSIGFVVVESMIKPWTTPIAGIAVLFL